ncbi:phosphocholine-specific phospholipase C [Puia sp.]|uniref:phosphocholine-specific phospholipase C n=1 Tax=Puia sp. TaxID=2045100 RepID=UPI002F3F3717
MSDSRREFLKKSALLTGALGMAQLLPESIQRALAITPEAGSTWLDAQHIVILMQENRSFDHALGMLRGVRGYNDPRAIDLPTGNPVWLQANAEGQTFAPFRLDIHHTRATWMNSLPHSWANQVGARNDGKFDKWLDWKKNSTPEYSAMPLTMGYHTREDLPFYYALADAFTVCDQSFCSSLTGTNPNRLHFWTGTIREAQHEDSRALVWNDDMDYGTLKWTTFPERLEDLGVTWKCYQNEISIDTGLRGEQDPWLSNFQDNPLEFFAQYNIHLHPPHIEALKKQHGQLSQDIADLEKQIAALPAGDAHLDHLRKNLNQQKQDLQKLTGQKGFTDTRRLQDLPMRDQALHRKAFDTNTGDPHYHALEDLEYKDGEVTRTMKAPKGDVLHQFRRDVHSGNLPTVSWLSAPENFSDHPSAPWYGAWYVSEVMDILTQNPEVWKKTIFILAYDENDGYFDHVPPFTAAHPHKAGTGKVSAGIDTRVDYVTLEQEQARNGFPEKCEQECSIGLGFRVPLIVASPWSRGGYVNSQVFDHTSTLQLLERFLSHKLGKPVVEPNISAWRRTVCGDLSSVFRPYNGEPIAQPEFLAKDAFLESIHKAKFRPLPDDFKAMTAYEIAAYHRDPKTSPYRTKQEAGTRPSCALPHSFNAVGRLSADREQFDIVFSNPDKLFGDRTAGGVFNVYAPGEGARNWAYTVKAGDCLSDTWPLADFTDRRYHLRVYGPNGFYREFRGSAGDPDVELEFGYEEAKGSGYALTGNGELTINNRHLKNCDLEIVDNAYGAAVIRMSVGAGGAARMSVPCQPGRGWYDITLRVKGAEGFEHRYAGRVETGREGISDPQMA